MTVTFVVNRLANMYELIPGITTAYPYIPRTLQAAQLPAIVIEPGEAAYDAAEGFGDHMVMTTGLYRATLFYDQALFGTENQSETGLLPMIDSITAYFFQRPGLQLDTDPTPEEPVVYNAKLLRTGGYRLLSYPIGGDKQADFATVTFFHQVMELTEIEDQY